MAANKRSDTTCERRLRSEAWKLGLRFRKNVRTLPGCPDLVLRGACVAVFCDGDFWHGRNWRARRRRLVDGSNAAYWVAKIEANMRRDKRNAYQLRRAGWTVVRFWEGQILADPRKCAETLLALVQDKISSRRGSDGSLPSAVSTL
jgi:DNA mismatch endonuclease (patch repair protein)